MAVVESYVQPTELYRYRSLKSFDRELEAIERRFLYCAAYDKLNDPMEGLFRSTQALRMGNDYLSLRDDIIENKLNIGICSFSEIHDHGPMWAHYADEFRGICVAYRLPKLLAALPPEVTFVRMFYNEDVPDVRRNDPEPIKKILSYKNYRWLSEREWRMFGALGLVFYKNPECVARVYLGSRMSDACREQINTRLRKLNIETHEMVIEKYSIGFQTVL